MLAVPVRTSTNISGGGGEEKNGRLELFLRRVSFQEKFCWCLGGGRRARSPASTVVIIISAPIAADLTSVPEVAARSSASMETPSFCSVASSVPRSTMLAVRHK